MLHVATARGVMSWRPWRDAYESLMQSAQSALRLSPVDGTRLLDSLGHVESCYLNGDFKVASTPGVLTRLPRTGLPVAVFCGRRSPQTERKLRDAATRERARFIVAPRDSARMNPPRAFFVEAENAKQMAAIAAAAGVQFAELPGSWCLVLAAADLDSYLSSLSW